MCDELNELDLSIRDFGEWLLTVFEHEVPDDPDAPAWYNESHLWVKAHDPLLLIQHFTRLCNEFDRIAQSFSLAQVDQGLWFLLGPKVAIGDHLADESIAI